METVKIVEKAARLDWEYDQEADVLYLNLGRPRKAVGVDIGDGVVVRIDEKKREVVGVTILGMRARVQDVLTKRGSA